MTRCRDILLAGVLAGSVSVGLAAAAQPRTAPPPQVPGGTALTQYYEPERRYGRPRYERARRVCWTARRRIRVGYDGWGRAVYRTVPRRVCRWRYR